MKMNGQDSAEYQIWVMKGHNSHLEVCLSHKKTKNGNSDLSSPTKIRKNVGKGIWGCITEMELWVEREGLTSL